MTGVELRFTFQVTTPLFMGGADPTKPELRPPSLKGLLRFWYRAVDPNFALREAALFGARGDGGGQSPFRLRVEPLDQPAMVGWSDLRPEQFNVGKDRGTRNGLVYLGFPFPMQGRRGIAPGHRFVLSCRFRRPKAGLTPEFEECLRAVTAAAWLLGHFGGTGSRARRGFGTLTLVEEVDIRGIDWPDGRALPLISRLDSPEQATAALSAGLRTLREVWFPGAWGEGPMAARHPHLGARFDHRLISGAVAPGEWGKGLNGLGRLMQDFRQRRAPDYQSVKDELARVRPLDRTPERAAFGLPLTFRYGSLPGTKPITLAPYAEHLRSTHERHGSLIFLRLLQVGGMLHPLVTRLDGAIPGNAPPAAARGSGRRLQPTDGKLLERFLDHATREGTPS